MIVIVEKDSKTGNITISLEALEKLIEEAKEEGRQEILNSKEFNPKKAYSLDNDEWRKEVLWSQGIDPDKNTAGRDVNWSNAGRDVYWWNTPYRPTWAYLDQTTTNVDL